ncbi:hypothetical protein ASALC70_03752 [Alcanivorax sp. ALC70]|nr:hypothetical protein HML84_20875 [Alcanivorax sp. IO_7]UWN51525.1 hypothetical protein ASALC70_03752 [Alcanivorax sp. ALC70]
MGSTWRLTLAGLLAAAAVPALADDTADNDHQLGRSPSPPPATLSNWRTRRPRSA